MIRLTFAELRQDPRLWAGPLLVAAVTGGFVYLAAVYWWTLGSPDGSALLAALGFTVDEARIGSYMVYVSTAIPAIIVIGTSSSATVSALAARIARWRLAGATPSQVRLSITIQVLVVNLFGTTIGILAASPFRQPAADLLVRIVIDDETVMPVASSLPAAALTLVGTALICAVASFTPARRAARISAVRAVRDDSAPGRLMPLPRWIIAILVFVGLVAVLSAVFSALHNPHDNGADVSEAASLALMSGLLLLVQVVTLAPILLPGLTRLWMTAIPPRLAPAWYLARMTATGQPRRTATAIVPISIGIGIFGIFFGIFATWQEALVRSGDTDTLNALDTYVILAPAAAIAITGSMAGILITTRARTSEAASIRLAGAAPRTLIGLAVAEAISYTITATVIALGTAAVTATIAAAVLTAGGLPAQPVLDLRQSVILAGIAAVVLFAILVVPAGRTRRGNLHRTITAP